VNWIELTYVSSSIKRRSYYFSELCCLKLLWSYLLGWKLPKTHRYVSNNTESVKPFNEVEDIVCFETAVLMLLRLTSSSDNNNETWRSPPVLSHVTSLCAFDTSAVCFMYSVEQWGQGTNNYRLWSQPHVTLFKKKKEAGFTLHISRPNLRDIKLWTIWP
jgi:hypothetical protein